MATSAVAMKWLELLEKEFDRAYLDLDILLGEVDEEQCDITYEARRRMSALSSAFAQLCHKAQTVFETNEKLEVSELIASRFVISGNFERGNDVFLLSREFYARSLSIVVMTLALFYSCFPC
ncbi:hypothetical protein MRX96_002648 [Rhipicephalus microplus]